MRVAWLVSEHGWGHLSRSLVGARALRRRGHAVAMVVAPSMVERVRVEGAGCEAIAGRLDRGYAFRGGQFGLDAERTAAFVAECVAGPDPELVEAVRTWAPDVLVADATPWVAVLGEALRVPSVLVSNFSWDDQYEGVLGLTDDVRQVRALVSRVSLGLELPLGCGLPAVAQRRQLPLMSQVEGGQAAEGAYAVWAFGGIDQSATPVEAMGPVAAACRAAGVRLLVDTRVIAALSERGVEVAGVEAVPAGTWGPALLAGARLVVTKAGYSTIAETLRGTGSVLAVGVTGLAEERAMFAELEARGAGVAIAGDRLDVREAMVAAVGALLARGAREAVVERGEEELVGVLEALTDAG